MCRFLETIQFVQGRHLNLDGHQARVNATFTQFFPGVPPFLLRETLLKSEIPEGDGKYKCRLLYDERVQQLEYVPYSLPLITSLRLVPTTMESSVCKSADRSEYVRAFALREGCDDVLLIRNGLLTDTSYCNVALFDGTLWVTPLTPLLYGIRRAGLLLQGMIVEKEIPAQEILRYRKIRLFNAMIGFGELEFEVTPETVR